MADIIQLKRDTREHWEALNPLLADGEMGIETVTYRSKIGDGLTHWNDLPYITSDNPTIDEAARQVADFAKRIALAALSNVGYYQCDTSQDNARKVVTAENFVLIEGGSFKVKFTESNTASNVTLNINNTGEMPLYYGNRRASATNCWSAGTTLTIYFDGDCYKTNTEPAEVAPPAEVDLATRDNPGIVQIGDNIQILNGLIYIPNATSQTLGVVKIGDGLQIAVDGLLTLRKAAANALGGIKIGAGLSIDADGVVSVDAFQGVEVDTTLNILKVKAENNKTYYCDVNELANPDAPAMTAGGTFILTSGQKKAVTITNIDGGIIYYTTDGTDPTTESTASAVGTNVTINIEVDTSVQSETTTVKAIIVKNGLSSSITSHSFTLKRKISLPTISRNDASNEYSTSAQIKIECDTTGVTIYYTTDGTDPTTESTVYSEPFVINATTTVKALAVKTYWENSSIKSEPITLNRRKMWYKAVTAAPTTEAQILNFGHSIEAKQFPQTITFTEVGDLKGCFCYDKALGNLTDIIELPSNYSRFSVWTKTEVGNYNVYTANSSGDFNNAKFEFVK